MFLIENSASATTEYALFGINHSDTKTNWFRNSTTTFNGVDSAGWSFDGVFYDVESDGSALGDYVGYSSPPTAGMNPTETLELTDQIRGLRDRGVTILLIEHKLSVVNEIAEKVIVLDHGEKIAEGTPAEVHSNEEVLRAYLGRTATEAVRRAAAAAT